MLAPQCNSAIRLLATFLNECPDAFGPDDVRSLSQACRIPEAEALALLVAAGCGLEIDECLEHRELYYRYIRPAIRELHAETYLADPWWQTIRMPEAPVKIGNWELSTACYKPYEVFVANDMTPLSQGGHAEDSSQTCASKTDLVDCIPQLGYFSDTFRYPIVKENGREWMTVTPNEVETMRHAIDATEGHSLTFGLGLGYFAVRAALRPQVSHLTVIENNADVIRLFRQYTLPQVPQAAADKIEIIQDDAFHFASTRLPMMPEARHAFVDLWHDVSDGLPLYLKMQQIAVQTPWIAWQYWIEKTMRCYL